MHDLTFNDVYKKAMVDTPSVPPTCLLTFQYKNSHFSVISIVYNELHNYVIVNAPQAGQYGVYNARVSNH